MEEPEAKWKELWLHVFVHGPEVGPSFNKMFARARCFKADTPDDADLVVFSGSGHDVNPKLYGATKHHSTFIDDSIDKGNLSLIAFCRARGIPMMGVCGGAQILHVAMGGSLYQDVDSHNSGHSMWTARKPVFLIQKISSVHHQMCIENSKMNILGYSYTSKQRSLDTTVTQTGSGHKDIEAFTYPEEGIICFQGHPEYSGYPMYTKWCIDELDMFLNENPDLAYRANDAGKSKLRIRQDLMDAREAKKPIITTPTAEMIIVEPKKG